MNTNSNGFQLSSFIGQLWKLERLHSPSSTCSFETIKINVLSKYFFNKYWMAPGRWPRHHRSLLLFLRTNKHIILTVAVGWTEKECFVIESALETACSVSRLYRHRPEICDAAMIPLRSVAVIRVESIYYYQNICWICNEIRLFSELVDVTEDIGWQPGSSRCHHDTLLWRACSIVSGVNAKTRNKI